VFAVGVRVGVGVSVATVGVVEAVGDRVGQPNGGLNPPQPVGDGVAVPVSVGVRVGVGVPPVGVGVAVAVVVTVVVVGGASGEPMTMISSA
jgi:hypothetical protein